jgi:LPS-assembly lipoprotein
MLSSDRRLFCLGLAAALGGCGFRPVYGPGGSAAGLQNAVLVDAPLDRDAYLLTREIEDRLGRATDPRYGLSPAIITRAEAIAISSNNITTRYNLLGEVTYALREIEGGKVLTSGKVSNFTSYSASGTTVATQAAERDARERLMVMLAGQIIREIEAASVLTGTS